jgi:inner membrane protein
LDNITHSLIGLAAGELALPSTATRAQRRLLLTANVVAANLPDIDVLYTGITAPPLGYLLHHRGYTHTLAGILGLGLLMAAVLALSPLARRLAATNRVGLWLPVALNLLGHVWLDSFNTYGVHPFYPFDASWYYGDAVFIFEPWLWVLLGIAAIANARGRVSRLLTGALIAALLVAVGALGVVPLLTVAMLAATAAALAAAAQYATPRMRSAVALGATAACMGGMFGLSRAARAETLAVIEQDQRGEIVDIVLSPDPAVPVCWTAIVLERDTEAGQLVLRRGTLSLSPASHPPASCVSHRFTAGDSSGPSTGSIVWREEIHQPLAQLRDLHDRDCRVSAWLQFGRAPVIRDGQILDLRFETGRRGNFTAMSIVHDSPAGCPTYVTPWELPRADLLGIPNP